MYLRFSRKNDTRGHAIWQRCSAYERMPDGTHHLKGVDGVKDGLMSIDKSFELVGAKEVDEMGRK